MGQNTKGFSRRKFVGNLAAGAGGALCFGLPDSRESGPDVDQVSKKKRSITMEPMPPDERRIVHITLANNPDIATQSTGEGDERRVVIQSRKR